MTMHPTIAQLQTDANALIQRANHYYPYNGWLKEAALALPTDIHRYFTYEQTLIDELSTNFLLPNTPRDR